MVQIGKLKIERQEMMYIGACALFAMVWFGLILQIIVNAWGNNYAVVQFLLFDVGTYFFFIIFLKALITDTKLNLQYSFGLMFLMLALDMYMPEFHVSVSGQLIPGGIMGVASSDYIIGLMWQAIGIHGVLLFILTYSIFPILFFIIAAKLLPNFVKKLG